MLHDYQEMVSFYVLESVLIYKMNPSFNNFEALVPLKILRSSFIKTVNIFLSCFFSFCSFIRRTLLIVP